ncbi:hypothetical protein [Corynebacterium comes]|uniref:TOMM leader peptide-binding protein n=1 Tax=Corynebacterium comes TaxID=2675218 RepID=A0A6B8W2Q9_9CORY|nr:hypothetical protein [Corynebacterium comes]QGU03950.1 hypothetical protein CETAM_03350 [Corynebacterium comes]
MFELAAGAHVFLRGRDALQFGLDATRAGIIETTHAAMLMATLLSARRPRGRPELLAGLVAAGLSPTAAASLLDDLIAYRILVPCVDRSVILLGRGQLAQSITDILSAKGVTVRSPIRGESEFAYLAATEVDVPIVVVDRLAHSRAMAPMLTRFARTWVSCSVIDHRGVIGPLRIDAHGPCPLCADLHRTDSDDFWHRVVTQLPGGPARPDAAVLAATAAQASVVVAELVGCPPPPGYAPPGFGPGAIISVDPWSGVHRETMTVHPRCPVCFTFNGTSTAPRAAEPHNARP